MPKYSMPLYEVKYHGENDWKEISDLELMNELYKLFNTVTPIIREMIKGEEVETLNGTFRLKLKGGDHDGANPN